MVRSKQTPRKLQVPDTHWLPELHDAPAVPFGWQLCVVRLQNAVDTHCESLEHVILQPDRLHVAKFGHVCWKDCEQAPAPLHVDAGVNTFPEQDAAWQTVLADAKTHCVDVPLQLEPQIVPNPAQARRLRKYRHGDGK